MKNLLIALSFFSLVVIGCNDDNKKREHVIVAGYARGPGLQIKATWVDNVLTLGDSVTLPECAYIDDDGNTYYGGTMKSSAAYWKNGAPTIFEERGVVQKILILNGDIYCAGQLKHDDHSTETVFWKNGKINKLSGKYGRFLSLFASGGDVFMFAQGLALPRYWKNGIDQGEIDFGYFTPTDMYAVNNEIHFVGNGAYFKNSVKTELMISSSTFLPDFQCITGYGNDIYIGGSQWNGGSPMATYWKNGSPTVLEGEGQVLAIKKIGDDIYAVGWVSESPHSLMPVYWKNGVVTKLPVIEGDFYYYRTLDIGVSPK